MSYPMDAGVVERLQRYFEHVGGCLRDKRKRESFAMYAMGLLGDGERKSAEPMAARASDGSAAQCQRIHDKLLHFVGQSAWDDHAVRLRSARYAIEAMSEREPVTTWVIDDTGFLKQGKHSVGVQRQYTGSAGKVTNCQVGVSLSVATQSEHVPIDFELYLPKSWTDDAERREEARIPQEVYFKTKIDLALDMIARAIEDKIPGEVVLADSGYGDSHAFRTTVRMLGLDYAVAIRAPTLVWCLDAAGRRRGEALRVEELGRQLPFRRITWRQGTSEKLSSRFAMTRVKVAHEDGTEPTAREPEWLILEWLDGEIKPTQFFLTTLRKRMSKKQLIRLIKERWRTERVYEELKGELGLDHFEGRSFPGWHHHISVALCCYAFVVAERMRHFPPSQRWPGPGQNKADTLPLAA